MHQQKFLQLGTGAITKEAYGTGYHKDALMRGHTFEEGGGSWRAGRPPQGDSTKDARDDVE